MEPTHYFLKETTRKPGTTNRIFHLVPLQEAQAAEMAHLIIRISLKKRLADVRRRDAVLAEAEAKNGMQQVEHTETAKTHTLWRFEGGKPVHISMDELTKLKRKHTQ